MSRSTEKTALFISAVTPKPTGKGVAMRAYWTLRAIAERRRTTLLLVPIGRDDDGIVPEDVRGLCDAVHIVKKPILPRPAAFFFAGIGAAPAKLWTPAAAKALERLHEPSEWRLLTQRRAETAAMLVSDRAFDLVHTFRLYAAPITEAAAATRPDARLSLDLDDIESLAYARLGDLRAERGELKAAAVARRASAIFRRLEDQWLPRFDRLTVCSEADRALLIERYGDRTPDVRVAPNVVPAPARVTPPPRLRPYRFLFVGALGYFPNADALRFFLTDVSPALDAKLGPDGWTLDVVGRGGPAAVAADLRAHPRIRLIEEAPEMPPAYARVDAVVAPIRSGGGTRIKILEAFAEGRPVVSTTIGAEGVAAAHRSELLLADAPEAFAAACAEIVQDNALAAEITRRARALVIDAYAPEAVARGLLGEDARPPAPQRANAAQPAS